MFYPLSGGRIGQPLMVHSYREARALFAAYALGFTAIAGEIFLLNLRAWRLRRPLRLNAREKLMSRHELEGWSIPTCVGLIALVLALTLWDTLIAWSGWICFSLALLVPIDRWRRRRSLPGAR